MNTYSIYTLMLKISRSIGLLLIVTFILMGANCPPITPSTAPPAIKVTELPALTLFTNSRGYWTGPETSYTVGENHRFQVQVKVEFLSPNAGFSPDNGVSIIWINPENNNEEFAKVNLKPGTSNIYTFVLQGSENLELCEAYFYRWSIVYDLGNGTGIYLGEAQYVMGSQKRISPNSIQQALCIEPENPWGI